MGLQPNAPVEPLVLRAKAGDCIDVTLRNALPFTRVFVNAGPDGIVGTADDVVNNVPDPTPDLAGWQDLFWVVNRDQFAANRNPQMRFFNNNLIRPSSYVGLHTQLVEYDASRDDGVLVGQNAPGTAGPVAPGGQKTYRWYAGDLRHDGDPRLATHVLNAVPRFNERGFTLQKSKSRGRIDGAIALALAVDRAVRQEPTPEVQFAWA